MVRIMLVWAISFVRIPTKADRCHLYNIKHTTDGLTVLITYLHLLDDVRLLTPTGTTMHRDVSELWQLLYLVIEQP
jgi:hypothetical protein